MVSLVMQVVFPLIHIKIKVDKAKILLFELKNRKLSAFMMRKQKKLGDNHLKTRKYFANSNVCSNFAPR